MSEYDLRQFPAGVIASSATETTGSPGEVSIDERTAAWLRAVLLGFLDQNEPPENLAKYASLLQADGLNLIGVYPANAPNGAWDPALPVATFADFTKTINIGYGRLVPAHLISYVTVRPTHRRRGLLRRMMTTNLDDAAAAGRSMAVLTASEGGIYRRFGFGPATHNHGISVQTDQRFRLASEPSGTVEIADGSVLADIGPRVFETFHTQSPASVDRIGETWAAISGAYDARTGEPNKGVRAALHYNVAGDIDGYVSYQLKTDDQGRFLEVLDLVPENAEAYLGLWGFLASIDLVNRVIHPDAPEQDPLSWALTDPRVVTTTRRSDVLWLRLLDVAKALQERAYAVDGTVTLRVDDLLGHAQGTFRLDVEDGQGTVRSGPDDQADLRLDVADLGSLYLGAVSPVTLAAAGRIDELRAGGLSRLGRMLATERPPYGITHF